MGPYPPGQWPINHSGRGFCKHAAAGDVGHGSMKRVAAAVGEGASAVRSVRQAVGAPGS